MPKITMLGAGSAFTSTLMRDIMMIPGLDGGELALVDIDAKRLKITQKLIESLADRVNGEFNKKWTVVGATDRMKVLKGSDYIVNCIEVSGTKCVRADNDIPAKYGVDQCIGDTIGPGGVFKALRTVPAWIEILHDVEEHCPDALIGNYTNPMSIMTLAAVRNTSAQVIGLCHSVQGTSIKMADVAKVPYEEMRFRCAGINHLAWLTELTHKGKDLYPRIYKRAQTDKEVYESDPVRFEMMYQFGAFITESSGHLSEYVPFFRKRKELVKKYCRDGYRGGSSFYADNWPKWRVENDKRRKELAKDCTSIPLERGVEYMNYIIESHLFNKPQTVYGSVLNDGLISNLPDDGVVEVGVTVDGNGFNPTKYGKLPPQMAALCASHMPVYDLVVRGLMDQDREAIIHAMMLDPLTAAVCCPAEIREMAHEMILAEKAYIPKFMSKGVKKATGKTKKLVSAPARRRKAKDSGPFSY